MRRVVQCGANGKITFLSREWARHSTGMQLPACSPFTIPPTAECTPTHTILLESQRVFGDASIGGG